MLVKIRRRTAILIGIAWITTAATAIWVIRYVREANGAVDQVRRTQGDVTILKYSPSFRDADAVVAIASKRPSVESAGIFSIARVQVEKGGVRASALFKLRRFDKALAKQLAPFIPTLAAPRLGEPPGFFLGTRLARSLSVHAGDIVVVQNTENSGGNPMRVRCEVIDVVDWGNDLYNDQLIYGDLARAADFGLSAVGVELVVEPQTQRSIVAHDLQTILGPRYKVMTLEDLVLSGPPSP